MGVSLEFIPAVMRPWPAAKGGTHASRQEAFRVFNGDEKEDEEIWHASECHDEVWERIHLRWFQKTLTFCIKPRKYQTNTCGSTDFGGNWYW